MGKLRFGCSGWSYQEWVGPFYRSATESKLAAYARVFDTAEIDSTFYRPPTKGMVLGWARYTPTDFRFAAKVPQTVTHDRLCDVDLGATKELLDFCELMRPLLDAGKLGPLLLQLPPRLRFEPLKLEKFVAVLPSEFSWAVEPRNKTWMVDEAFDLLRAHNLAYTIVDEPLLPIALHSKRPPRPRMSVGTATGKTRGTTIDTRTMNSERGCPRSGKWPRRPTKSMGSGITTTTGTRPRIVSRCSTCSGSS